MKSIVWCCVLSVLTLAGVASLPRGDLVVAAGYIVATWIVPDGGRSPTLLLALGLAINVALAFAFWYAIAIGVRRWRRRNA